MGYIYQITGGAKHPTLGEKLNADHTLLIKSSVDINETVEVEFASGETAILPVDIIGVGVHS